MDRNEGSGLVLMLVMLVGSLFYVQAPRPGSGETGSAVKTASSPLAAQTATDDTDECRQDAGHLLLDLLGERDDFEVRFRRQQAQDFQAGTILAVQTERSKAPHRGSSHKGQTAADTEYKVAVLSAPQQPPLPSDFAAQRIRWIRELANAKGLKAEFLVATVPDPIDSHVGWQFDAQLSAIQRAIENAFHFPDRYSLPWTCAKGTDSGSHQNPDYRRMPGVMLFRAVDHVLVLFLVGETPTTGLHKDALREAIQFINDWGGSDYYENVTNTAEATQARTPQRLQIIGPTFSGTLGSLRMTIWQWWTNHCHGQDLLALCDFEIISGTATGSWIPQGLMRTPPNGAGGTIDYQSMVIPDDARNSAFIKYLNELRNTADGSRVKVAILTETGTAFGQRQSDPSGAETAGSTILKLPFPLHISRVRSAQERLRRTKSEPIQEVGGTRRPEIELSLDDDHDPRDVVPSMAPPLTAASDELALAQILSTIAIEGIQYVGILATDTRDTLFLARQIRKYCPDVQLFTFESDVLFTHPDYSAALEGAVVLSTYPLFSTNQRWSFPFQPKGQRFHFPSERAQGAFNATIVQLRQLPAHRYDNLDPLEYSSPEWPAAQPSQPHLNHDGFPAARVSPPLWISVVGRGGFWPLGFATVTSAKSVRNDKGMPGQPAAAKDGSKFVVSTVGRIYEHEVHDGGSQPAPPGNAWRFSDALFLVVILVSLGHCLLYAVARSSSTQSAAAELSRSQRIVSVFRASACAACRRGQQVGMLLSLYALLAVDASFLGVYRIGVGEGNSSSRIVLAFLGCCVLIALTAIIIVELVQAWSDAGSPSNPNGPCNHPSSKAVPGWICMILWCLVVLGSARIAVLLSADLICYLPGNFPHLLAQRALNFGSGTSPLAVALFLGTGLYLGGLTHLRRLHIIDAGVGDTPFEGQLTETAAPASSSIGALALRVRKAAQTPWQCASLPSLLIGGLLLWVLPWASLSSRMLPSFEGRGADRLLSGVFLLYIGIVLLAFVQLVGLWTHLRRLLRRLATHPLLPAFGRLPSQASVSGGRLWSTLATAADHELAADQWTLLGNHLRQQRIDEALANDLPGTSHAVARMTADAPSEAADTRDRTPLLAIRGQRLGRILECAWQASPLKVAIGRSPDEAIKLSATEKDTMPLYTTWNVGTELGWWLRLAEEHVALQMAFFLNQQLVQIRNLLGFITVAILLFLLAINAYPFQPRGLLGLYAMTVFASALVATVTVLIQIDKDPVLSRIAGTTPNKLDRSIILPVFTYAVLPFLGLLATQFPELSGISSGLASALRVLR